MNLEQMNIILDKIKEYQKIILFRHIRPDGDAVGSTKGFREILRLTYPEKTVLLINADFSDYTAFLGEEDAPIAEEEYKDALGIVLDTATKDRISNPLYALCRETVKIDHHIPVQSYATYEWVEEHKSSTCEMVAEFYHTFRDQLKINEAAATYLYAGMVTDSGRFRFRSVSGDTLRYAGMLMDQGIYVEHLYANLYMREFETFKLQVYLYSHMKITENGVAYFHVTDKICQKFGISVEQASASVSHMDSIKGSLIWIAFIDTPDGSTRVRLRSRFLPINTVAEHYRGGGHDCASGATVKSRKEMNALIKEADALLGEYKRTHEGLI